MTDALNSDSYPKARREDLVEDLPPGASNTISVADPYRWLEDENSAETAAWSAAQDELFKQVCADIPGRETIVSRVGELMSAGVVGLPVWRGARCFFVRRSAEQEHAVLYVREPGPDGAEVERAVVDPMELDPSGTTTLDSWQPSKEGNLLAYQVSEGGSEESTLRVIDVASGDVIDGPIDRARYSPVAWLPGEESFYYVRRMAPEGLPAGEEQYHRRVWWHRVGAKVEDDVEVFGAGRVITSYYDATVSMDGRWLVVSGFEGTDPRSDVYLADLKASSLQEPHLVPVVVGEDAQTAAHVSRDGRLYLHTDLGSPRGRIAVADPTTPGPEAWTTIVSERPDAVLEGYVILDGPELGENPQLLVAWTTHAVSEVSRHDLRTGEKLGTVELPGLGTVAGLVSRPEGSHLAWLGYTDNTTVPQVLELDARSGEVRVFATAPGTVEVPAVTTQQIEVTSKDGTTVRAFVMARTDSLDASGAPLNPCPTVLYGYGGFGHSLTPSFSPAVLTWVEAGGVYVVASLRGGGEEGEEWHRAGMLGKKQNVFDDFHAVGDALVEQGWTTREKLAISGGSNGGLLVGAALTQRPDAYRAVVCSAPLLDMVRYQKHGLGQTWTGEYGDALDPQHIAWLHAYSPYHRVEANTEYPAVLFTVFAGDTRVDTLHARKLCAALQHATTGSIQERPILVRCEGDVGHGARAVSRTIGLTADTLSFLAHHTGLIWR